MSIFDDTGIELFTRFMIELFGIIDAAGKFFGIENSGGGYDRTCPRAAACLIYARYDTCMFTYVFKRRTHEFNFRKLSEILRNINRPGVGCKRCERWALDTEYLIVEPVIGHDLHDIVARFRVR